MIVLGLVVTALAGAGVALLVVALAPPSVGLAARVGQATGELAPTPPLAERLVGRFRGGVDTTLREDLALVGVDEASFVLRRLQWVGGMALLAAVLWPLVVIAVGASLLLLPVVVTAGAAAGWPLAAKEVRDQADERRREARLALSEWLQMTANMMLAGTSLEQAMRESADAGTGWTFEALRTAFRRAVDTSTGYPEALDALGGRTGLVTLREIAVEVRLSLEKGAGVARTVADRAAQLRADEVNVQLADAEAASQKVAFPLVGLAFTFLAFIAYPAIGALLDL